MNTSPHTEKVQAMTVNQLITIATYVEAMRHIGTIRADGYISRAHLARIEAAFTALEDKGISREQVMKYDAAFTDSQHRAYLAMGRSRKVTA